jgi:hypothetical protein
MDAMYFTEIIAGEGRKSLIEEANRIRIIGAASPEKTTGKKIISERLGDSLIRAC